MGDPAGIGPDVTLAGWRVRGSLALPPFAVYGDPQVVRWVGDGGFDRLLGALPW